MAKFLEGIRVVELSTHVAVPKVGRLLAEWGAEVIKVENPKGEAYRTSIPGLWKLPMTDDNNPLFEIMNAGGKKSISLDLKNPEALEVMYKLIGTADIFITNTRTKALGKLGLDYETLKAKYPKLIYGVLTGFGEVGPEKDRPGFDITSFWARSGVLMDWTLEGNTPPKPQPGFGDGATAAILLSGVLAALINRDRTGEGTSLTTSLLGTALWYNDTGVLMGQPQYKLPIGPKPRVPDRPLNPLYKTKDGDWILSSVPEWTLKAPRVMKVLGMDEYIGDPRFADAVVSREHSPELVPLFDEAFGRTDTETVLKGFEENDINHSKLTKIDELYKDEQAWAIGSLYEHTLRGGEKFVMSRPPIKFSAMENETSAVAPLLGEHSVEILAELGYTTEEIEKIIANGGVVKYEKK